MKKLILIFLALSILILSGCRNAGPAGEIISTPTTYQTDPEIDKKGPAISEPGLDYNPTESVSQTERSDETKPDPTTSTGDVKPEGGNNQNEYGRDSDDQNKTSQTEPVKPTDPPVTRPAETQPVESKPTETQPKETEPPATTPKETVPKETEAPVTEPPATEAPTEPEQTEPEETEPAATEITYEFKRQVASYAAQYINAYRGSSCTVLSGMSQVAQYRASQLTWNYGHSTSDKRAALAYYEYGRYIDATEFGDDASNSYWEADSAEAICAGFYGTDPEAMGKRIADLIRNSSGHWSYISSSEYSYIGVGVEYREGSEYGWYCCVMVGSVNYG